ncbi:MAG: rod shape-determining protein RodA [Acidimicrobiaceae bacterium]|uniref:rod shape-determining protein RodA n=1 Tax=Candidatus Poriferisodalis multihospitum TaxID=2983191 RepID=UPI0013840042|nr:rod shape-determining protein RodA [Candidatus Poriferisodalis multihospitum]MCY3607233.1 rod shape-determining protein RodA [Acidimicrobiaceae bacterium]MXV87413.1 rod shape-determining protein RodA [Acidimicrobiales bacterium]MCY3893753.1 rod shape-determining protein RodA [Acidimicrobiaceae bacterium]MCY3950637.1 rod shape-determining protein RodA [Acidimicrobiaceae bacterium]MDE0135396.1 rod shape-determining protein RodA [Acidimicrobiaceae bacterium]
MIARLLNRSQTRRELQSPAWFADYSLALAAIAIALLGVAMNYSSTWRSLSFEGGDPWTVARRQAIFVGVGIVVMIIAAVVDYRVLRFYATPAYLLALGALGGLLFWGPEIRNARSWFVLPGVGFQVQPSEFAKLVVIVSLAAFVASHEGYLRFDTLFNAGLLLVVPMSLIYLQPDLGTMLVFVAVAMGMLLVAGAQLRHIVVISLTGILALVLVFSIDAFQGPRLLNETQRNRLTAFLDQDFEPLEASYNLRQSQIAIGAGGIWGQGWKQGTQTNLDLVPEQHNDFIFTALGEEFGLVGGTLLLALYAYMSVRIWQIARVASDPFGRLLTVGILSMLLFQVFQNIGMTIGIMPITGIPLPLMSHGGSGTVTAFAAVGIVISVGARRFTL